MVRGNDSEGIAVMTLVAIGSHVWRDAGNGKDRFSVKLRSPSYDDRLKHQSIQTEYALASVEDRMQIDRERIDWCVGFVDGWRDVLGESGEDVEFSREHLNLLIVAHPRVMLAIVSQVEKLLASDLTETQRGN